MKTCLLTVCVTVLTAALEAQGPAVNIPLGETALADIGVYAVAYQSYGGEVVTMPASWIGHFDPVCGISYVPHERLLERDAILLHSPWHVPPGKVWVDYRLKLPQVSPIALSFGITMSPMAAELVKSDGVT